MQSLVGYCAPEQTSPATATEQKTLSEEELYQKQQAELDKQMVEKVDEIRGRLKKFVREVRKVSPATADFLVKDFFWHKSDSIFDIIADFRGCILAFKICYKFCFWQTFKFICKNR
jgi:hypothetical protein